MREHIADELVDLFHRDAYQFQFWALTSIPAFPAGGEKKKGADAGIHGVLQFRNAGNAGNTLKTQQILVQVKGGHVSVSQLRDLRGTLETVEELLAGKGFEELQLGKKQPTRRPGVLRRRWNWIEPRRRSCEPRA